MNLFCEFFNFFTHSLVDLCENALDLGNSKLTVQKHMPIGINCHWLISAADNKHYIDLEFENVNVRIFYTFIGENGISFRKEDAP